MLLEEIEGNIYLTQFILGKVTPEELGLGIPYSWAPTIFLPLVWLGLMRTYSPIVDWLAARWFPKLTTLEAFNTIQQSRAKVIAGILTAWVLGCILEEHIVRGIVLQSVKTLLASWFPTSLSTELAVCIAVR